MVTVYYARVLDTERIERMSRPTKVRANGLASCLRANLFSKRPWPLPCARAREKSLKNFASGSTRQLSHSCQVTGPCGHGHARSAGPSAR